MFSEWFKALWTPKGRSNRARYWSVVVASICIMFGLSGIAATAMIGPDRIPGGAVLVALVIFPIFIAVFVVGLFNDIKRLHDLGRSGWWLAPVIVVLGLLTFLSAGGGQAGAAISSLATVLNLGFVVTLGCLPGQPGANRFGAPMNQPTEAVFS